ncbi:MAG: hypothetical protein GY946_21995 [bacterium]|nr:hypothetical protein [bacterium]
MNTDIDQLIRGLEQALTCARDLQPFLEGKDERIAEAIADEKRGGIREAYLERELQTAIERGDSRDERIAELVELAKSREKACETFERGTRRARRELQAAIATSAAREARVVELKAQVAALEGTQEGDVDAQASARIVELEAKVARLTKENARGWAGRAHWLLKATEFNEARITAEARRDKAHDDLARYGAHQVGCPARRDHQCRCCALPRECGCDHVNGCTCGLQGALARANR